MRFSFSTIAVQQQKRQLNATRWTVTSTKSSIAMPSLLLFIYPINCNTNNRLSMRCVIDAPALRFNVQAVQRFMAGEMPNNICLFIAYRNLHALHHRRFDCVTWRLGKQCNVLRVVNYRILEF